MKHELQNILSGKSGVSHDPIIQAVTRYLRTSKRASPMAQEKHENKLKEAARLIDFVNVVFNLKSNFLHFHRAALGGEVVILF